MALGKVLSSLRRKLGCSKYVFLFCLCINIYLVYKYVSARHAYVHLPSNNQVTMDEEPGDPRLMDAARGLKQELSDVILPDLHDLPLHLQRKILRQNNPVSTTLAPRRQFPQSTNLSPNQGGTNSKGLHLEPSDKPGRAISGDKDPAEVSPSKIPTYVPRIEMMIKAPFSEAAEGEVAAYMENMYRGCPANNVLCRNNTSVARSFGKISETEAMVKLLNSILRKTYTCDLIIRIGRIGDGGYQVCMDTPFIPQKLDCIVYSFGINYDFSFDIDMRDRFDCEVHSFDPSMSGFQLYERNVSFHEIGLSGDTTITGEGWNLRPLDYFLDALGHSNKVIDILKVDIEGSEWSFLRDVLRHESITRVKQIILEIHSPKAGTEAPLSVGEYAEMLDYLEQLERLGFLKYHFNDENNCCGAFTMIVDGSIVDKNIHVCCYELFLVNGRYL